jgi:cell division protein FtsA
VVTGGSSIMEGVPELAERVFDQPVRRGVPGNIGRLADIVRTPIHATGVGLAVYGLRRHAVAAPRPTLQANDRRGARTILQRMAAWFGQAF